MRSGLRVLAPLFLTVAMGWTPPSDAVAREGEGGRGFFMVGRSTLDVADLNSSLDGHGYSKLDDASVSFGGAGYGILGRLLVGGEGHGLESDGVSSGGYEISLGAGYGMFNLGYLLISSGNLNAYPMIGFGAGGVMLNIRERGVVSFDEVLDNPLTGSELSAWSLLLSVDLGADYLVDLSGHEHESGGIALGVRVGYTFPLYTSDWSLDEVGISGGPEVGIAGPHIRFMIGGGGGVHR